MPLAAPTPAVDPWLTPRAGARRGAGGERGRTTPHWWPLLVDALPSTPPGPVVLAGTGAVDAPAGTGREVAVMAPGHPGPAAGGFAACVLAGTIETLAAAAPLVEWAYGQTIDGGLLVTTVREERRGERTGVPRDDLARLLFQSGFSAPRFHRRPGGVVVTARRAAQPPTRRRHRLSVVIPAYNEAATFAQTMDRVLAKDIEGLDIEVIVVESNSTDGTREEARRYGRHPRVTVVLEDRPRGKGHAVRQGLAAATGDFVLIQDADLEYDVDDYEALLSPLRRYERSFVLGRRVSGDRRWGLRRFGRRDAVSLLMNVGHLFFLGLFDLVYWQRLRDPFTMYKVFRRDCLEGMTFECDRFDFDWELAAKLIRAGYHPVELPVAYRSRSFSEGKKIRILADPVSWMKACARHRFSRLYTYR